METYTSLSERFARELTLTYSTSFGTASRFFEPSTRCHIFNIYGLVRIADEIVDTYKGGEQERLLNELELDVLRAVRIGYSTNLIVQAYALTARQFSLEAEWVSAFFRSMRMDLAPFENSEKNYTDYIYGSAEVIGLMCLQVFVRADKTKFKELQSGARSLGSAYQKVNFLRDVASDHGELGRIYFPGVSFDSLDTAAKDAIIRDIETDFEQARLAIRQLPRNAKLAVEISFAYYSALLKKLKQTDIETIKTSRVRVSNPHKFVLLLGVILGLRHA